MGRPIGALSILESLYMSAKKIFKLAAKLLNEESY